MFGDRGIPTQNTRGDCKSTCTAHLELFFKVFYILQYLRKEPTCLTSWEVFVTLPAIGKFFVRFDLGSRQLLAAEEGYLKFRNMSRGQFFEAFNTYCEVV